MARSVEEIIAQLRAAIANPAISTTLIQTEDLAVLCDAAEPPLNGLARGVATNASAFVLECLRDRSAQKEPSFEYRAAHFLVGAGLVGGDLDANVRGLTALLKKEYDIGVEHGAKAQDFVPV